MIGEVADTAGMLVVAAITEGAGRTASPVETVGLAGASARVVPPWPLEETVATGLWTVVEVTEQARGK